jgi:hypothetical protein
MKDVGNLLVTRNVARARQRRTVAVRVVLFAGGVPVVGARGKLLAPAAGVRKVLGVAVRGKQLWADEAERRGKRSLQRRVLQQLSPQQSLSDSGSLVLLACSALAL